MLSAQAIKGFKEIYRQEYGKLISDTEASEKATKLLNLFKIIYRPPRDEDGKEMENEQITTGSH